MNKKTITIKLIDTQENHWYEITDDTTNESIYLPSVTNILECFPNKGLDFWRETTNPEQIRKAQEEGKIQGSKVHHCAQLQIMGQTVLNSGISDNQISLLGLTDKKLVYYLKEPLTGREEAGLIGLENFWEEYRPVPIKSELMVYSKKYGWAGTLDFAGYLYDKKTKKYDLWLVDFKISKTLDRGYDLQLVGYWKALQETYKKRLSKIRLGILQLGKNKIGYSFKEVKDKKIALNLLVNTKKIWDDINKGAQPKTIIRREQFNLSRYNFKGKKIIL